MFSVNGLAKAIPFVAAIFGAGLIGLALGLGIYPVAIALIAITVGLMLIVYPVIGLWVVIIGALAGAGLADLYMPQLKLLVWGLTLLAYAVASIALIKSLFRQIDSAHASKPFSYSALVISSILFVLCTVFSSLVNWHGVSEFLVGLKSYFQVWAIIIAIYYLIRGERDARRLMSFFLLLGILQLPFVLHQFFVLIPQRSSVVFAEHGIVAGDIVAGTFGGSMMGGGRSSNLALLCVICVVLVLARWRAGRHTLRQTVLVAAASVYFLFPMFLSEAKLFLVLLPAAVFLLYRDRILSNPLKTIVGVAGLGVLVSAIFFSYSLLPGAESQHVSSLKEMLHQNIEYNFGKRGYGNQVLNRLTVYPFWLKEHSHSEVIVQMLIGHGPGATSGGTYLNSDSLAYARYRGYGIGLTGLASLLWEIGLIGTIVVLIMFFTAYRLAGQLAVKWSGGENWAPLKTAQITIALFLISLLHNNYFVFDLGYQAMLLLVLGYVLVMARISARQ